VDESDRARGEVGRRTLVGVEGVPSHRTQLRNAPLPVVEPLAPEDLEILRLESPTVAGHAMKIMILDPVGRGPRPDAEALRARIADRIERAPRLRRKLNMGPGRRTVWVDDPGFDLREHVRPLPVAKPVSDDELRRIVARVMEERLDRSRSLWTINVLDRLEDGGTTIIWKIHHGIADGVTAMRFAKEILWDVPTNAGDLGHRASGHHERAPASPLAHVREALSGRWPGRLPPTLRRELQRTRHPSPFDGVIGSSRTVAFASLPLGAVKRAAKALVRGATVNDVVLALVAGGLRRWAEGGGRATVRVKVPVSLHHLAESAEAANRDSFFVVSLPLGEPDPVERLRRINAETALCKRAGDALVFDTLRADLGHVAPPLWRMVERPTRHPRAFALNVSNVPGPRQRPSVLGAPVRALYSIAEIRERHGLRVAVISMADELHFGLCADPLIVGDLDPLVTGILAEASALLYRADAAGADDAMETAGIEPEP
jgi:WS/DGAT/MGAT family acyltransferase